MEQLKQFLTRLNLQFFAGDGEGDGEGQEGQEGGNSEGQGQGQGENNKTFSQEDLDKIIQKRLAKAQKQWQTELEEAKKKEQMTAEERLKAEKTEAENKAKDAVSKANNLVKTAEAKAQALALGVKPEKVTYLLKLADLDSVEVSEGGEVDQNALKGAIETVLKDLPELKGATAGNGGGDFSGGSKNTFLTPDQIKAMSPQEVLKNWEQVSRSLAKNQ